ncbi:hypothetical protein ACIF9R_15520 [Streptomyces sp. NPDC086080]|uniref:hypothetical protein n=1 Tax=Streptomyces sp. NPDC086080 TaxID=3365748 RepID=UPI0037D4B4D3
MTAEQLQDPVREFTNYLRDLLTRLDRYGGWCLVFWRRDPESMRACLEGREPPPWDVMESLLQDLATAYGPGAAEAEAPGARSLHTAALDAYDARPGAREALSDRLDVMLREQRYAAERRTELTRRLASAATPEEARALRDDLAWAEDDHARATARCAEINARTAALDRHARRAGHPPPPHGRYENPRPTPDPGRTSPAGRGGPSGPGDRAHAGGTGQPAPAPGRRKRRRGGARFAGAADDEGSGPVPVPPAAVPSLPAVDPGARGARFAGAAGEPEAESWSERPADAADRREVARTVATLARLRGEGRGGEAHALLNEVAYSPAARFPLLADAMRRAGLGADWATLLWEAAAAQPADRLATAADALAAAGRAEDGDQILRQGVVRPADEIGQAVLTLDAQARHGEARALLDACVRMRTPVDAARTAAADPRRLVPLLLTAARAVSDTRHRELLHALRVVGFAT